MKQNSCATKKRKIRKPGSGAPRGNRNARAFGVYARSAALADELAVLPELAALTGIDHELLALRVLLLRHLRAERADLEAGVGGDHEPEGKGLARYPIETLEVIDTPQGQSRRTTRQRSPILERILTIIKGIGRLEKTKAEITALEVGEGFLSRVAQRLRDNPASSEHGCDLAGAAAEVFNDDVDEFLRGVVYPSTPQLDPHHDHGREDAAVSPEEAARADQAKAEPNDQIPIREFFNRT